MGASNRNAGALIVEDEPLVALYVESVMSDLGFTEIRVAHDLETAEALLAEITPEVAVLDVNIGSSLVFPIAESLRARGVPLVFSTGRARTELPPEWEPYSILPKPLDPAELECVLEGLGVLAPPAREA
jgi:DNA-binding response OmpR family regulator